MENNNIDKEVLKELTNMTPDELEKIQARIKEVVKEIETMKAGEIDE